MLEVMVRPGAPDEVWVVLSGELDLADRARVEAALATLTGTPSVRRILLDVRELDFLDVTSLSMLVRADERLAAGGRHIVIVRRREGAVGRVLHAAALDAHLEWVVDPADIDRPRGLAGPRYLRGDDPPEH